MNNSGSVLQREASVPWTAKEHMLSTSRGLYQTNSCNGSIQCQYSPESSHSTLSPSISRTFEHVILAAQQQQLRQWKRLQQLKKQSEITAAQQAALKEKELAEEQRKIKRQAELAEAAIRRAEQADRARERRQAALEAVERQRERALQKLELKLARVKPGYSNVLLQHGRQMSAMKSAIRMHETLKRKQQVLEGQRQAILSAEAAIELRMQEKQELRLLQEAIKREEDLLAEERRREIQARAEADKEAKCAYYLAKQKEREKRLLQRQQQAELQRIMRAEEAQARFDHIRSRAAEVGARDEERRSQLARKLETKMLRVDMLAAERTTLTNFMRNTLITNELQFKKLMERAKTDRQALPLELLDMEQQLQEAISSTSELISPSKLKVTASPEDVTSRISQCNSVASRRMSGPQNQLANSTGPYTGAQAPQFFTAAQQQRQQESALQCILEEEIIREMDREVELEQTASMEERKSLLKRFDAERELTRATILSIGSRLLQKEAPAAAESS